MVRCAGIQKLLLTQLDLEFGALAHTLHVRDMLVL